jgi:TPR repeat protein
MPLHAAAPHDPAQDEKIALELRQQVDRGNGDAALRLGNLLARKRVSAAKYGKAPNWYKKGCALDDLSACHNLGVSYEHGRNGVANNYAEAAYNYLKSAERAFLPSMLNLARLHADSKVIPLDNRDGLKWMLIAQKAAVQCAGHRLCDSVLNDEKGYRARLEARLSPTEQQETRQLADAWQPAR